MGTTINVTVGKSTLVRLQAPIARIVLGNPDLGRAARPIEIETTLDQARGGAARTGAETTRPGVADVDVVLLSPQEIYLLGKSVGSTNFVLVDRSGQCTVMDVIVGMDTAPLRASLAQLLPGERNVVVSSAADSLVLTGSVADAAKLDRVLDLANAYVRRAELAAPDETGASPRVVNLLAVDTTAGDARSQGGRSLEGADRQAGREPEDEPNQWGLDLQPPRQFPQRQRLGPGRRCSGGQTAFQYFINALRQNNVLRVLAEPNLMAISGQEGSFLAGGKVFLPVPQFSGGAVAITLQEQDFGVGLKFTPTVLEGGRINLRVSPEVSELSPTGVSFQAQASTSLIGGSGRRLPLINTRRASTTVQLYDGQTFAIGGLIQNNITTNIKAFPVLGEIPVLGALFRSTAFQSDKTELIFVITPRLVKPLAADYRLPTDSYIEPTRLELFLGGKMEGDPAFPFQTPAAPSPPAPQGPGGFEVK
jgi:pilus assembly protein CpaC